LLHPFSLPHPPLTPLSPLSLHDALPISSFPAKSIRSCVIRSLPTERGGVDCAAPPAGSDAMSTIASNVWLTLMCPPLLERACARSEEHTSELQSLAYLVCRLLLEKKNKP